MPTSAWASPPARSEDGSAELQALRELGVRPPIAATEVEVGDARGLEYGIEFDGTAGSTNPQIEDDTDVLGGAERSLVLRRARRLKMSGFWLIFTGGLLGPACVAGAVSAANSGSTTPMIVWSSLSVVTLGLLAIGIPLVVRGVRMTKRPEQFALTPTRPAPWVLTTSAGGLTLRF